jgi:hypothetical protein
MNAVILIDIPFNRSGRSDEDLCGRGEHSEIFFALLDFFTHGHVRHCIRISSFFFKFRASL